MHHITLVYILFYHIRLQLLLYCDFNYDSINMTQDQMNFNKSKDFIFKIATHDNNFYNNQDLSLLLLPGAKMLIFRLGTDSAPYLRFASL